MMNAALRGAGNTRAAFYSNTAANIVNVILATFIFGQGDDYTIFITDGLINEYAYKKKIEPYINHGCSDHRIKRSPAVAKSSEC